MSELKITLQNAARDSFQRLGFPQELAVLQASDRPDIADFQCNAALALARALKRPPREIAERVAAELRGGQQLGEVAVAGPGFINFVVSNEALAAEVERVGKDDRKGVPLSQDNRKIILDYGGPNIAKPMHVGHLRSSIIGECLKRLFRFLGHEVIADIHLGDWGTQMGMLIRAVQQRYPDLPYFDPNFAGDYPAQSPVTLDELEEMYPRISAQCETNAEEARACSQATMELQSGRRGYRALWKHFIAVSLEAVKRDLRYLDVDFDQWFGESRYQEAIPAVIDGLLKRGYATREKGAIVVDFKQHDPQSKQSRMVIQKSDGGFLYSSTDLATIDERVNKFGGEILLYVVDARQSDHFQQVFETARAGGIAASAQMEHIKFGTMNGPDGKPFKTRAGGVMKLQDLIEMLVREADKRIREDVDQMAVASDFFDGNDEARHDTALKVGIAALKFADLQHDRAQDYKFEVDKFSRFEGKTGPYLLYTLVRIKSLMERAKQRGLRPGPVQIISPEDRSLAVQLIGLDEAVHDAYVTRAPHHLCEFAYKLCQRFNALYHSCRIVDPTDEGDRAAGPSRLALCETVEGELEILCRLLGISVPERM